MQALSDLMKLIESGEHGSPFQEIQHPKKRAFLSAYVLTAHKGRAAEAVGIDLSTTYKPTWVGDEEFQAALARARVMSGDALEAEVIRRGVHGIEEPVLYQGEVVEYIRRYSDNLLMFQTKSVRPEYRERLEVRGSGAHRLQPVERRAARTGQCRRRAQLCDRYDTAGRAPAGE
ncbi:hypothetical protein LCGC14_2483390 [marine sediment metagenome]|uniref:Uncharacterized protein n=1 Tax=marine sediment metagenome TaxID=412755 RepID=A0A0F9B7M8_9ZZZZ